MKFLEPDTMTLPFWANKLLQGFAFGQGVKNESGMHPFAFAASLHAGGSDVAPMIQCLLNRSSPFESLPFCKVGWVRKSQRSPRFKVNLGKIFHWSDPYSDQLAKLKLTSPSVGNSPEPPVGKPKRADANDIPLLFTALPEPVIPLPNEKVWKVLIWSRATQTYPPPNLKSCLPSIQSRLDVALQSGLLRIELPRFPISLESQGPDRVATMPLN